VIAEHVRIGDDLAAMNRSYIGAFTVLLVTGTASGLAQNTTSPETSLRPTSRALEIRSYNLKPHTRDRFHQLFLSEALPMLQRWKIDVVAYGPSLHDDDTYFLMRAFPTVDDRARSEDAFYGSDEWRNGLREAVLSQIVSYTTTVISLDEPTIGGLRRAMSHTNSAATDLETLVALNEDYVRSVSASDVKRFDEILPMIFCVPPPTAHCWIESSSWRMPPHRRRFLSLPCMMSACD
jgi:hypothetical protein